MKPKELADKIEYLAEQATAMPWLWWMSESAPFQLCNDKEIDIGIGDDSGWERLVSVDRHAGKCHVELRGSEMTFELHEIEWLVATLSQANKLVTTE